MAKTKIIVAGAAGRMGSLICQLIHESDDLELAAALERPEMLGSLKNLNCPVSADLDALLLIAPEAVVIDFTAPEAAMSHARIAAARKGRIVIGATGIASAQKAELAQLARQCPLLWSANMSVGVNALMRFLPELARALGPGFDMEMVETHHRHKKDAPSGTALMLGEAIAEARGLELDKARVSGRDGIIGERKDGEIGIMALRGGDVPGIHSTFFFGYGEIIEVKHEALSRSIFARGALRAARWLAGREPGKLYSMRDVIA